MSGPKVVPFEREGWREGLDALKQIVADLESGEIAPIHIGALVLMDRDGAATTFVFGPRADEVSALGLLRMGEQIIVDSALSGE